MGRIKDQLAFSKRVQQLINISHYSARKFAIIASVDSANFSRKMKNQLPWTTSDAQKICKKYLINYNWLVNGEGDMYDTEKSVMETTEYIDNYFAINAPKTGKPYYNVDFDLGYDLMVNDQTTNPDYTIDFEPYNKCDCWCNARGNSMYPTISSGDAIAIKEISDHSYLISGEIYAIVTTNELRTIKRVKDNGDTITLIPDNKEYPEQTIPKSAILKVFKVLGTMKTF